MGVRAKIQVVVAAGLAAVTGLQTAVEEMEVVELVVVAMDPAALAMPVAVAMAAAALDQAIQLSRNA